MTMKRDTRQILRTGLAIFLVGAVAAFLASDLGKGITGTTLYVDKGYHAMGKEAPAAPGV